MSVVEFFQKTSSSILVIRSQKNVNELYNHWCHQQNGCFPHFLHFYEFTFSIILIKFPNYFFFFLPLKYEKETELIS